MTSTRSPLLVTEDDVGRLDQGPLSSTPYSPIISSGRGKSRLPPLPTVKSDFLIFEPDGADSEEGDDDGVERTVTWVKSITFTYDC